MRKRSRTVALGILGAASFAIAGCRDEQVEAQAFPDLASCKAAAAEGGLFTAAECEQNFAEAQELHVETAPRYDSLQVCEEQHGEGNCGSEDQQVANGGSGSIFMPLIAGYLIGSMLGGGGFARSQPMYRTPGGGYTNAAGTSTFSGNTGRTALNSSQFARPATTTGQAPMTRATPASRGGFGATGASRSVSG